MTDRGLTILRGGFRTSIATELWILPPGVDPPSPSATVREPKMPVNKTFLFAKTWFAGDDTYDPLDEFILPSVKEREKDEAEEWQKGK